MKLIIPLVLGLLGLAGGVGARMFLMPADPPETEEMAVAEHECAPVIHVADPGTPPPPRVDADDLADRAYVKMKQQFVVPVISDAKVAAMVVMSMQIETKMGQEEVVHKREPKLRDLFLQTLFDHASTGRFSGEFANAANLAPLRDELTTIARRVLGEDVSDVLITEIGRQDS